MIGLSSFFLVVGFSFTVIYFLETTCFCARSRGLVAGTSSRSPALLFTLNKFACKICSYSFISFPARCQYLFLRI